MGSFEALNFVAMEKYIFISSLLPLWLIAIDILNSLLWWIIMGNVCQAEYSSFSGFEIVLCELFDQVAICITSKKYLYVEIDFYVSKDRRLHYLAKCSQYECFRDSYSFRLAQQESVHLERSVMLLYDWGLYQQNEGWNKACLEYDRTSNKLTFFYLSDQDNDFSYFEHLGDQEVDSPVSCEYQTLKHSVNSIESAHSFSVVWT